MRSTKMVMRLTLTVLLLSGIPRLAGQTKPAASKTASPGEEARIHRIETGVVEIPTGKDEPPLRLNLQQLMELYKIPGLSIAVIDNFQIAWAKGYAVVEMGSNKTVTTKTLFQAGSISKPVAATGALFLVQNGKLSLDENVNDNLKSWKVPDNEFTKTEKVTLRRILSHTAGLTVHGFPGYDVDASLLTTVRVLNGEKPANTPPVRVDMVPGTKEMYSGGGVRNWPSRIMKSPCNWIRKTRMRWKCSRS